MLVAVTPMSQIRFSHHCELNLSLLLATCSDKVGGDAWPWSVQRCVCGTLEEQQRLHRLLKTGDAAVDGALRIAEA